MAKAAKKAAAKKAAPKKASPKAAAAPKKGKYEGRKLLRGHFSGINPDTGNRQVYHAGETVPLTASQIVNLGDQFE